MTDNQLYIHNPEHSNTRVLNFMILRCRTQIKRMRIFDKRLFEGPTPPTLQNNWVSLQGLGLLNQCLVKQYSVTVTQLHYLSLI